MTSAPKATIKSAGSSCIRYNGPLNRPYVDLNPASRANATAKDDLKPFEARDDRLVACAPENAFLLCA